MQPNKLKKIKNNLMINFKRNINNFQIRIDVGFQLPWSVSEI